MEGNVTNIHLNVYLECFIHILFLFRIKPDIMAPGHSIYSAKATAEKGNEHTDTCNIVTKMGTSMATPVIAGNYLMYLYNVIY